MTARRILGTALVVTALQACSSTPPVTQQDRSAEIVLENSELTLRMLIAFAIRTDRPEVAEEFKQVNILYNNEVARFIFDGEPMPTGTSQRLIQESAKGNRTAIFLCDILNEVDPGHCP